MGLIGEPLGGKQEVRHIPGKKGLNGICKHTCECLTHISTSSGELNYGDGMPYSAIGASSSSIQVKGRAISALCAPRSPKRQLLTPWNTTE